MKHLLKYFLGLFLCISANMYSQEVSCTDLVDFVKSEGRKVGTVSSYQLIDSSWLKSVSCYDVDGTLAVIANIKTNDYSLYGKDYIFCGISKTYWDAFYYGYYDLGRSYGERFHKYIFDYKCDCY